MQAVPILENAISELKDVIVFNFDIITPSNETRIVMHGLAMNQKLKSLLQLLEKTNIIDSSHSVEKESVKPSCKTYMFYKSRP